MKFPFLTPATGILLLILVYMAGVYGLAQHYGVGERFSPLLYSTAVVRVSVMLFLFFVGWRVYSLILFQRPAQLTKTLIRDVCDRLFTREQIRAALPIFIAFMFFMSSFTSMKGLIPLVQPYHFDADFATLDRAMHGGIDPWRILHPVFGHPALTAIINVIYNLWFAVMFSVLYWQLFDLRRPQLRMRFFWSFFLTWIITGSVLAVAASSAGPCFFAHVVPNVSDPYADLMTYLRATATHWPVWAVETQDQLWTSYQGNVTGMGSGISAMPSVHVAIATLFALLAFQYGLAARWFFTLFAVSIMIGSVHLGWHYAIDGYAGAIVTVVIWLATGFLFKEVDREKVG